MYPILFKLGPLTIHTYGLLVACGFLVAIEVIKRLAARLKFNVEQVLDIVFWGFLVGLLGARVLFVFTRIDFFIADPLAFFRVWEGGFVFWGGPLVVIPYLVYISHKTKLPVWALMDCATPGLVIGHSIGRWGCLAAGCCYGKPTGSSYGVRLYSDLVDIHSRGVPLHPAQIYESFALLFLFFYMIFVFNRKHFQGQIAISYLLIYPVLRSFLELFRGDLVRGFVIQDYLSTSQFISILIFILGLGALRLRYTQIGGFKSQVL